MSHHDPKVTVRHYDQLKSVMGIAGAISGVLRLDDLLPAAVATISRSLRNAHVGLLMIQGDRLVLRAASDRDADQLSGKFSLEIGKEGITGWVAASGQSVFVPDVSRDPRYVRLDTGVPVRTALAVPLRVKDRTIGVVDVDASEAADLNEDDLRTMEIVAEHVAGAIGNACQYMKLQEYAGELEEQVRQRTIELDEAREYVNTMKTIFENNERWDIFRESDSPRPESTAPSFDPIDFGTSMKEGSFPETSILTGREVKILELIAQGLTDKAIAQTFVISPHTVNAHLRSIYRKLHTHTRTGAVNLARRNGIIE